MLIVDILEKLRSSKVFIWRVEFLEKIFQALPPVFGQASLGMRSSKNYLELCSSLFCTHSSSFSSCTYVECQVVQRMMERVPGMWGSFQVTIHSNPHHEKSSSRNARPQPAWCSCARSRTVRASGTVYCHKVAVARRQGKIVATWTLKVRASSLTDCPSSSIS